MKIEPDPKWLRKKDKSIAGAVAVQARVTETRAAYETAVRDRRAAFRTALDYTTQRELAALLGLSPASIQKATRYRGVSDVR